MTPAVNLPVRHGAAIAAIVTVFMTMLMLPAMPALAQVAGIPAFNISEGDGGSTYSLSLQILALMTALTLLPSLVLGMTSFTRIIIVLSILRQAMGTQQTPPNQVLIAIALRAWGWAANDSFRAADQPAGQGTIDEMVLRILR